ncbi:MAG: hypothetical protein KGK01_06615 [Bradyrhizobium sp.]|uniref:hypothetical protein n=1 Tax=Bradyrhizobium sp. TaxID=376 RepID=UPI001C29D161|nr:hypothetical protein [Pseudomonadota bacterium]MDE2069148.1 hypothetical protein [Bradyrhizobium sp.]MDE2242113.1 hypothetical protein [Bradyrhizobium sp.]
MWALLRFLKWTRQLDGPEARGLRLLRAWLSPKQRDQFDAFRYFDVAGSATGKKYRIHLGVSANVQEIGEDGAPNRSWCFMPAAPLVAGDVMLAQKIALETNECDALAVAHQFPIRPDRGGLRRQF